MAGFFNVFGNLHHEATKQESLPNSVLAGLISNNNSTTAFKITRNQLQTTPSCKYRGRFQWKAATLLTFVFEKRGKISSSKSERNQFLKNQCDLFKVATSVAWNKRSPSSCFRFIQETAVKQQRKTRLMIKKKKTRGRRFHVFDLFSPLEFAKHHLYSLNPTHPEGHFLAHMQQMGVITPQDEPLCIRHFHS